MNIQETSSPEFPDQNPNNQHSGKQELTSPDTSRREASGEDEDKVSGRTFSRDEIIALLKECAKKLGHVPTRAELIKLTAIKEKNINRHFGSYQNALRV